MIARGGQVEVQKNDFECRAFHVSKNAAELLSGSAAFGRDAVKQPFKLCMAHFKSKLRRYDNQPLTDA
jgi:hypothetical protein